MADESHYSSATDTTPTMKRKYDDQAAPPPSIRRTTGFSSPPDSHAPSSYNSVPPPVDEIQMAKQKAQEIAARLLSGGGADVKRARVDSNGSSGFDSTDNNKGFSSAPPNDMKSYSDSGRSSIPVSHGSYTGGSGRKIEIPNGRVGVIIGKGGETIKYLQIQSGAKIQVQRDMDSDPNATTRVVELMGNSEQISKAEQLINEVLAEADAGGSGTVSRRFTGQGPGQGGLDTFVMKIPNNKVGLVIGKGGESIKNMQARTGARIQVIPLHLPAGDMSSERNVHIEGTSEQIEHAKQLVNEAISENRARNPSMGGGYSQQGYQNRQPSWGQHGAPQMQQSGYGYMQPGAYTGQSQQYNMPQQSYGGYPPQQSGGYQASWDESNASANQQSGYDYYNQQASSQQQPSTGGPAAPTDNSGYNYSQPPASGYGQQGQGYGHDGYGGYPQSGYGQAPQYDQQQGYGTASSYGSATNATQEGQTTPYGGQGDSAQAPSQQGYTSGQQPSPNASYPPQGSGQPGYGLPPSSQSGYGGQSGYGSSYGAPQAQKPPTNPPVYGQTQQSPGTPGSYGQSASGYPPYSQPPASGHVQPDSGSQRAPSSGYGGATGAQPGYGAAYGSAAGGQPGYGQGMPDYNTSSYASGYSQPAAYPSESNASNNTRASFDTPPASQPSQQSGAAKASPQS